MADVKRATRVAERVREELAWLLAREVRDPRAEGAIVSRVEMSDDLRIARVYVRSLVSEKGPDAVEGLKHASPLLRREVTKRAGLRFAPELRFFYDEGQDAQTRIEELLEEVKKERPRG